MVSLNAEIKVSLEAKENFLLDLKLHVYHYMDANEVLEKKLKGADLQMVESIKKIQSQSAELDDPKKIRDAATSLIDLVDPVAEGSGDQKTLLQCLQEAPHKFLAYMTDTTKSYVSTTLGF